MVWIKEVHCDAIRAFVKNCETCVIASKTSGEIIWANNKFLEWSGYSLTELQSHGWRDICLNDGSLDEDLEEMKHLDEYNPTYCVQKKYIPKNGLPTWGVLSVMRFPATGDIAFCVCTWDPFKNGTAAALSLTLEKIQDFEKKFTEVSNQLSAQSAQSIEDKALLSVAAVVRKYPKTAVMFMVVFLGMTGVNNVVQLLARYNLIPSPPVKVETISR